MDPVACSAPRNSLYLQPDGVVKVCCTTGHQIGRIWPERDLAVSLRSILTGPALAEQAEALDSGDFSVGCRECEVPRLHGMREVSLAASFDRFTGSQATYPKVIDFALSNRCNLQCVMCNGELSSAIRAHREHRAPLPPAYGEEFFDDLVEYLPHLEKALFKGGEPFLSVETRRVWDLMLELGVDAEVSVTTNGTIWNDRVAHYLRTLKMHAIVSVDGMTPETLESIRIGVRASELWRNIGRIEEIATATGRGMTLSWCLMPQNVHELGAFLTETSRRACNANVILVNQPHKFDLLQRPRAELLGVLERLETEGHDVMALLDDDARTVWVRTLDRLRAHLGDPQTVRVDTPKRGRRVVPDLAQPIAELTSWAGKPPLVMQIHGRRIDEVDAPDWAGWLEVDSWLGRDRDELLTLLAKKLGGGGTVRQRPRSDEWLDHTISFGDQTHRDQHLMRSLSYLTGGDEEPQGIYVVGWRHVARPGWP